MQLLLPRGRWRHFLPDLQLHLHRCQGCATNVHTCTVVIAPLSILCYVLAVVPFGASYCLRPSVEFMAAKPINRHAQQCTAKVLMRSKASLDDVSDVHSGATYPQRLLLVADWGMSSNRC